MYFVQSGRGYYTITFLSYYSVVIFCPLKYHSSSTDLLFLLYNEDRGWFCMKENIFLLIFDITYGDRRDRDHIAVEFISICAVTAKAVTKCSQYLSLVTWYLALDEVYSVVVSCDVVSHPWRGVRSGCLLWRGISPLTRCTQWLSPVSWHLPFDDVYSVVVPCDVQSRPGRGVLSSCLLWRGISPVRMCTQ